LLCWPKRRRGSIGAPSGRFVGYWVRLFHLALRGYRSAFPEEITIPGIRQAVEQAALQCAESFSLEVDGVMEEEKVGLRKELHANILEALMKETEVAAS
jgi:hypothetical protein